MFQRKYLLRLPLPIAQLYSRAHNAKTPVERHNNCFYLLEALAKLMASVAIMSHARDRSTLGSTKAIDELLSKLRRPSFGHWVGALRELARHTADRSDHASHPLGSTSNALRRPRSDWRAVLALYRRIRNGPDGTPSGDKSCSALRLLDSLVQYRNVVFGHGAPRLRTFYESDVGPLLFPAVNELLAEDGLPILGPAGTRLATITDVRRLADGLEVSLRELTGLQGERLSPLRLDSATVDARPGQVVVLWPGVNRPLQVSPLLVYRESELCDEVLFLNKWKRTRAEFLSYTTGRTTLDDSEAGGPVALARVFDETASTVPRMSAAETEFESTEDGSTTWIGDFEVLRELGRGGMGVVYLARQRSLGRHVALKMLPADLAGDAVLRARFAREIRALARCEHPNIVKLLDVGETAEGRSYFAMEYVPGCGLRTLFEHLTTQQSTAPSTAGAGPSDTTSINAKPELPPDLPSQSADRVRLLVRLFRDAARALAVVHAQDVVHRDVKPDNLRLTPDSRIVLTDFGLAKSSSIGLTASRGFLGTLRYAAPEQLATTHLSVSPATDVRGLGATFWELLCGQTLFGDALDERQLAMRVLETDLPLARAINPELDRDLEAILCHATARDPERRIPTATRLADLLDLYLDGQPLPIRPPRLAEHLGRWMRKRKPLVGTLVAALVLLVGVTVGAFAMVSNARDAALTARDQESEARERAEGLAEAKSRLAHARDRVARESAELAAKEKQARKRASRGLAQAFVEKARAAEREQKLNEAELFLAKALTLDDNGAIRTAMLRVRQKNPRSLTPLWTASVPGARWICAIDETDLAVPTPKGVQFRSLRTGDVVRELPLAKRPLHAASSFGLLALALEDRVLILSPTGRVVFERTLPARPTALTFGGEALIKDSNAELLVAARDRSLLAFRFSKSDLRNPKRTRVKPTEEIRTHTRGDVTSLAARVGLAPSLIASSHGLAELSWSDEVYAHEPLAGLAPATLVDASPIDSTTVVGGGLSINVLTTRNGQRLSQAVEVDRAPIGVRFIARGELFAHADPATVTIRRTRAPQLVQAAYEAQRSVIIDLAGARAGRLLAMLYTDGTIQGLTLDEVIPRRLRRVPDPVATTDRLLFTADRKHVTLAHKQANLGGTWALSSGVWTPLPAPLPNPLSTLHLVSYERYLGSSEHLYYSTDPDRVHVISPRTEQPFPPFAAPRGADRPTAALGPDGHTLAIARGDSAVLLYDLRRPREPPRSVGAARHLNGVAWSADGHTVAVAGGLTNTVRLISANELDKWEPRGIDLKVGTANLLGVTFDHAGSRLAAWDQGGELYVWSRAGLTLDHRFSITSPAQHVGLSEDRLFAFAAGERSLRSWDLTDPSPTPAKWPMPDVVTALAVPPSGDVIYVGLADGQIVRQTVTTPAPPTVVARLAEITTISLDPDGYSLVAGTARGDVVRVDLETTSHRAILKTRPLPTCATFGPAGRRVLAGYLDGTACLWDVRTRRVIAEIAHGQRPIAEVAVSPNGDRLATYDGSTVRVWSSASGAPVGDPRACDVVSQFSCPTSLEWTESGSALRLTGIYGWGGYQIELGLASPTVSVRPFRTKDNTRARIADGHLTVFELRANHPPQTLWTQGLRSGGGRVLAVGPAGAWVGVHHNNALWLFQPEREPKRVDARYLEVGPGGRAFARAAEGSYSWSHQPYAVLTLQGDRLQLLPSRSNQTGFDLRATWSSEWPGSVTWSRDERALAVATPRGVKMWTAEGKPIRTYKAVALSASALGPHGRLLFIADAEGPSIVDLESNNRTNLPTPTTRSIPVEVAHIGSTVLVADHRGAVWELRNDRLTTLRVPGLPLRADLNRQLAASRGRALLLQANGALRLMRPGRFSMPALNAVRADEPQLCFGPKGEYLVAKRYTRSQVIEVASGAVIYETPSGSNPRLLGGALLWRDQSKGKTLIMDLPSGQIVSRHDALPKGIALDTAAGWSASKGVLRWRGHPIELPSARGDSDVRLTSSSDGATLARLARDRANECAWLAWWDLSSVRRFFERSPADLLKDVHARTGLRLDGTRPRAIKTTYQRSVEALRGQADPLTALETLAGASEDSPRMRLVLREALGASAGVLRSWPLEPPPVRTSALSVDPTGERLLTTRGTSLTVWRTDSGGVLARHTLRTPLKLGYWATPKRLILLDGYHTLWLWEPDAGGGPRALGAHHAEVKILAAAGSLLASADTTGLVKVWDLDRVHPPVSLRANGSPSELAFDEVGQLLAVATDTNLSVWSMGGANVAPKQSLTYAGAVSRLALSRNGSRCAVALGQRLVVIDPRSGRVLTELRTSGSVETLRFGKSSNVLLTRTRQSETDVVTVWYLDRVPVRSLELESGRLLTNFADDRIVVWSADRWSVWSTQGEQLRTSCRASPLTLACARRARRFALITDKRVVVREAKEGPSGPRLLAPGLPGQDVTTYRSPHTARIEALVFDRSGEQLALASWDGTASITSRGSNSNVTLSGHSDRVYDVSFDQKGERLVTASPDGTAKVWHHARLVATLRGHTDRVYLARFQPKAELIVTASRDQSVRVWQPTGELVRVLRGHRASVRSIAFSPDGSLCATGSSAGDVRVWELPTGATRAVLRGHDGPISSVEFGPQGTRIATASSDGTARLWSAQTGAELLRLVHDSPIGDLALSPDGGLLLAGTRAGTCPLWDLSSGSLVRTYDLGVPARQVAFGPSGERILALGTDSRLHQWSRETGALQAVYPALGIDPPVARPSAPGWSRFAIAPRTQTLALSKNHISFIRALRGATSDRALEGHSATIVELRSAPDGRHFLTRSVDGEVRVWDLRSRASVTRLTGRWSSARFSAVDGLTTSSAELVGRWSMRGELLGQFELPPQGHVGRLEDVAMFPDGRVATGDDRGRLLMWGHDDEPKVLAELGSAITQLDASRNTLLAACADGNARLVKQNGSTQVLVGSRAQPLSNVAWFGSSRVVGYNNQRATVWHARGAAPPTSIAIDTLDLVIPDPVGRRLLTTRYADSTPNLRMGAELASVVPVTGHTRRVYAAAFDGTGELLATASDRLVIVRHLGREEVLAKIEIDGLPTLAFQPGSSNLAIGTSGTVQLWSLASSRALASLDVRPTMETLDGRNVRLRAEIVTLRFASQASLVTTTTDLHGSTSIRLIEIRQDGEGIELGNAFRRPLEARTAFHHPPSDLTVAWTGTQLRVFRDARRTNLQPSSKVWAVEFAANSRRTVRTAPTGLHVVSNRVTHRIQGATWGRLSPGGERLATDGGVYSFDATGAPRSCLVAPLDRRCRFDPTGRFLVTSVGAHLTVYDCERGVLVARIEWRPDPKIHVAAVSPDGELVAAANGTEFSVWSIGTSTPVRSGTIPQLGGITALEFTATGETLLVASGRSLSTLDLPRGPVEPNDREVALKRLRRVWRRR